MELRLGYVWIGRVEEREVQLGGTKEETRWVMELMQELKGKRRGRKKGIKVRVCVDSKSERQEEYS